MKYKLSAVMVMFLFSSVLIADNLSDSNRLFDWAEQNYPQYFSPAGTETFEVEGYLARHYEETQTYIGTQGSEVYVLGDIWNGLLQVGVISDFITEPVVDQEPIEKMVGTFEFTFTSGPFPEIGLGTLSDMTFSLPIERGDTSDYLLGTSPEGDGSAAYYFRDEGAYMVIIFNFLGGGDYSFEFSFDSENTVSGISYPEKWTFTGIKK